MSTSSPGSLTAVNTFEVSRLKDYLLSDYYGRWRKEGGEQRLADARAKHPHSKCR